MIPALAEVEKNTRSATGPRGLGFALLSGFLLTLAFPRWNLWPLAWVSLVPLFYALEGARSKKEAFFLGFLAGFTFYLLSIGWLRHVTVVGMLFVVVMEAAYWGVFAVIARSSAKIPRPSLRGHEVPEAISTGSGQAPQSRASEIASPAGELWRARNDGLLLLAAIWAALEVIRSEIPVWGFGWNLLGASQAANLWVAQFASVTGVYGVSALVFLGNSVLFSFLRHGFKKEWLRLSLFTFLLGSVVLFGWSRFQIFNPVSFFRVSVLQGNIPQILKWDPAHREAILRIYLNLTELASYDAPQLIVWPESAYPGFFNREPLAEEVKALVKKIQTPVLMGSPHQEKDDVFYNTAYLLESSGEVAERYDKIRLVPFGEYVPWKPIFGFLESLAYALGVSDFSPGKKTTVFSLRESRLNFSVLICFEDTFPDLARRFVERGADFLAVITNDAWFGHSSAPYQHLQASVFRAIENGISVVRAANTGVSGFITPLGQVVERVNNREGKDTFIMGGMTYPVALARQETFYRRGGWWFGYGCLAILILHAISSVVGAGLRARPDSGQPRGVAPTFFLLFILIGIMTSGCIRLQGGAVVAKKGPQDEAPQVKELYLDTDELVGRRAPGKIEV